MTKQEEELLNRIQTQIGAGMQIVQEALENNRLVEAIDTIRSTRSKFAKLIDQFRYLHMED